MSEHVRIRTTPNKNVVLLMRKLSNFVQKLAPMIDINIAKQQIINILLSGKMSLLMVIFTINKIKITKKGDTSWEVSTLIFYPAKNVYRTAIIAIIILRWSDCLGERFLLWLLWCRCPLTLHGWWLTIETIGEKLSFF